MTEQSPIEVVGPDQITERIKGDHMFQIPVNDYFHVYHRDEPITEDFIRTCLDKANNASPETLAHGVPNPAKIEAKIDGIEAQVWFSPNPNLPPNPRARQLVAEAFGWHMVFTGCVCITGLPEEKVANFIARAT